MFRWLALGRIRGARQARQIAETAGQRQVRKKKKKRCLGALTSGFLSARKQSEKGQPC